MRQSSKTWRNGTYYKSACGWDHRGRRDIQRDFLRGTKVMSVEPCHELFILVWQWQGQSARQLQSCIQIVGLHFCNRALPKIDLHVFFTKYTMATDILLSLFLLFINCLDRINLATCNLCHLSNVTMELHLDKYKWRSRNIQICKSLLLKTLFLF